MKNKQIDKYKVGDLLESEWGFLVLVCQRADGEFYGSLVCEIGDSCRNVPYSLDGKYKKILNIYKTKGF